MAHTLRRQLRLLQIWAALSGLAFVVLALDETFNPRLLERFLLMVIEGGAQPVVILNKADLCEDLDAHIAEAKRCAGDAPVVAVSAKTRRAMNSVLEFIKPGCAVVHLGRFAITLRITVRRVTPQ